MDTQKMALKDLRTHPLQQEFYGDHSDADDQALAADLRQRGQTTPIVVMPENNAAGLPGGTILDGHRRARLMTANGQTEATVEVRHDLKDGTALAVEAEFLRYNFHRRQLHPLDKARIAKRLYALEKERSPGTIRPWEQKAVRDRVGKIFNMSGKNLERYLRVLESPLVIQNAVRDRRLKLVDGAKIAALPAAEQKAIASAISGVADRQVISQAVAGVIGKSDGRHKNSNDAMASFVRSLERGIADVGDRLDLVGDGVLRRHLDTLRRAQQVIGKLLARAAKDGR